MKKGFLTKTHTPDFTLIVTFSYGITVEIRMSRFGELCFLRGWLLKVALW